jgi:hypothetical protein
MARRAIIIGTAQDIFGRLFDVRESRPTRHGFNVLLGWPVTARRGPGGGGPQVIITKPLAEYLEKMRLAPVGIDLPIGRGAVKRLRFILGHHWFRDNTAWWAEHPDGRGKSFAARHNWRKKFGISIKNRLWTTDMDNVLLKMLDAGASVKDIAITVGRSPSAIRARKWKLKSRQMI